MRRHAPIGVAAAPRAVPHGGGFTLVELIVVMAIMTLIGLFAALAIFNVQDHTKRTQTESTIRLIEIALEAYRQDIGHYPRGDGNSLPSLLTETGPGWKNAGKHWFPNRSDLKDAWGLPIQYCSHAEYALDQYGTYTSVKDGQTYGTYRGVERTVNKKDFYNSKTYQIYSHGPNMVTWEKDPTKGGLPRLCGTQEDDIRNWRHERFYTPQDYGVVP